MQKSQVYFFSPSADVVVVEIGVDGAESLLLQLLLDESLFRLAIVMSWGAHCDICSRLISLLSNPRAWLPSHDTDIVRLESFAAVGAVAAPVDVESERVSRCITALIVQLHLLLSATVPPAVA